MTTYYADPSGDDLAAGSEAAPFATMGRINHLNLLAGDRVIFSGGTEQEPFRQELRTPNAGAAGNPIRYSGDCVIAGSWNVTDGEVFEYQDAVVDARTTSNLWFDSFAAGVINTWTRVGITAGITEETTEQLTGCESCVQLDNSGGQCYLRQSMVMVNTPMRISVLRKNDATGTMQFDLQDAATTGYAQLTAAGVFSGWGALSRPVLANTQDWAWWTTGWISRDYASSIPSRIQLLSASGNTYIQALKIEYMATWVVHDATNLVYKIQLPLTNARTMTLLKSTKAEWASRGFAIAEDIDSFAYTADSLATIQAGSQPGKAWFDAANKTLYYQCAAGEALSDLHLECVMAANNAAYITNNYVHLEDLKLRGAYMAGLYSVGSNYTTDDVESKYNRGYGAYDGVGSTAKHTFGKFDYNGRATLGVYPGPMSSNGYLASGAGCTAVLEGCTAIGNGDDGFQNDVAAGLILNGCVAHSNFSEQVSISYGNFQANNCTFVYGDQYVSFGDYAVNDRTTAGANDTAYTRVYRGNIIGSMKVTADGAGNITASNNALLSSGVQDAGALTFTNQTGLQLSIPTTNFVDYTNGDMELAASSTCVGVGAKWWGANPRPVGANGMAFPDFYIDLGGNPSTHNPHHPTNL